MKLDFPYHETWIHRVNPSLKLALVLAVCLLVLFVHNINFMMNLTIVTLLPLVVFSGHSWRRLFLYSSPFIILFISTSASMTFFGKGETTWIHWGLLHITEESFLRGLHLGFRALNFAILGLLFAMTTRPVLLFYSLMQQCKLPPQYAYSFMAAIRLFPILFEEFQVLRYALKVRGVVHKRGLRGIYQKLQNYSIPLLAQSIRRAQRIGVAMESKRFTQSGGRTYYYKIGFSSFDVWLVFYYIAATIVVYIISIQYPYFGTTDVRFHV
jgi:energy-coupling factor transport system permease protein